MWMRNRAAKEWNLVDIWNNTKCLPHLTTDLDWWWKADLNWAGFLILLQRILLVSLGLSLEWRRYKQLFWSNSSCVGISRCSEVKNKCHLGCWWFPVPSKSWVAFDPKLILLFAIKKIWPTYIKVPGTVLQKASFFKDKNVLSEQEYTFFSTCQVHLRCNEDKMWF